MADDEIVRLLQADTRPHDDWFRDIGLNRTGFDGADGPTRSIRQSGIPSLPVRFESATPLAATGVGRMFLRATFIAAAIATAALAMAGLGAGLAHAGPNQTCTPPQWVTDWACSSARASLASTRTAAALSRWLKIGAAQLGLEPPL